MTHKFVKCSIFLEQILKAIKEKQQITHKGIPIRITVDLSIELFRPEGNGRTYLSNERE